MAITRRTALALAGLLLVAVPTPALAAGRTPTDGPDQGPAGR
jgi:hypothetical protein